MVMNMKVVQYIRTDKLKSEMYEYISRFSICDEMILLFNLNQKNLLQLFAMLLFHQGNGFLKTY